MHLRSHSCCPRGPAPHPHPAPNLWALLKECQRGGLEFPFLLAATTKAPRSLAVCVTGFQQCFVLLLSILANIFTELFLFFPSGVRNNPPIGLHPEGCCGRVPWEQGLPSQTARVNSASTALLGCPGLWVFLSLQVASHPMFLRYCETEEDVAVGAGLALGRDGPGAW